MVEAPHAQRQVYDRPVRLTGLATLGLAALALVLALAPPAAATDVGGTISVDTTWTLAGSPYVVTSSISVQGTSGADGVTTLTIEPGVVVMFNQFTSMSIGTNNQLVPGALVADGTPGSPITFTSNQAAPKARGYWYYLQFHDYASDSISRLDNVVIEYGGASTANLYAYYASPPMSALTVRESGTHGMYLYESGATISDSTIINNDEHGVYIYSGSSASPALTGNTFQANGQYGVYTNNGAPALTSNAFVGNAQRPLRMNPDAAFSGNTFTNTVVHEIELLGDTITADRTLPRRTDATSGNPLAYVVTGWLYVQGTSGGDGVTTLTLEPGVELRFDQYQGMQVGTNTPTLPGALDARGTAALPIVLTSNQVSKTRGWWSYLAFYDHSSDALSALENVTIEYAGSSTAGLYLYQAAPKLADCTLRQSAQHGAYLYFSNARFQDCAVRDNSKHGLYLYASSGGAFVNGLVKGNGLYGVYQENTGAAFDVTGSALETNAQRIMRLTPGSRFSGNTYTGNGIDEIEFLGDTLAVDRTWWRLLDSGDSAPITFVVVGGITVRGTDGADGVTALTIEPGVTVAFDQYTSLTIGSNSATLPGALVADGTQALPIVFTSHQAVKSKGYWGAMYFYDYASDAITKLENVTIEYGGYSTAGAYFQYASPKLGNCVFSNNNNHGVYLYESSAIFENCSFLNSQNHGAYVATGASSPVFRGSTLKGNAQYGLYTSSGQPDVLDSLFEANTQRPLRVHPDSVITGNTFQANTIQEIEFLGGTHTQDKTLVRHLDAVSSAPLTYVYTGSVTVRGTDGGDGVTTLTVAPGVTVAFDQYASFTVAGNAASQPGALDAQGTAALPIVFTSHQTVKTKGYWGSFIFYDYTSDTVSKLENVTIEYGGYSTGGGYFYYASPKVANCVFSNNNNHGVYLYESSAIFENCSFLNSQNHGVYVYSAGTYFPTIKGSTVKGNAQYGVYTNSGEPDVYDTHFEANTQRPLRVDPDSVITGNTFKGNTIQEIEFVGGTHTQDKTLVRHTDQVSAAPLTYVYTGTSYVQGTDGADGVTTLTVAPGVTVAFDQYVALYTGSNQAASPGALVADGTAAMPIVFTSHQTVKSKGYWGPLGFYDYADEAITTLRNITVEYGGYSTAGVYFYFFSPTMEDCTIRQNNNHGAYFYNQDGLLQRCTVSDNQKHGVYVYSGSPTIRDSTLKGNSQYGLYTESGTPDVFDNALESNTQRPLRVHPDSVITGNTFQANTIQEIEFLGGTHTQDKTLVRHLDAVSSAPLTYVYTGTSYVQGTDGADGVTTLTVEPGTTVAFNQYVALYIGSNQAANPGALVADGTAAMPVLFTSHQTVKSKGFWGPLTFYGEAQEALTVLDNVTIEYGGYSTAGVYFYSFSPTATSLAVTNSGTHGVYTYESNPELQGCTLSDNTNHGLYVYTGNPVLRGCLLKNNSQYGLYTNTGRADITGSTLQGNKQRPLRLHPEADFSGNTYRSNVIQEVEFNGGLIDVDETLALLTDADTAALLRYVYLGSITVRGTDGPDGVTTLAVDPGVTVAFAASTDATFGGSTTVPGALYAVGTPAQPILFTSAKVTQAAGDWGGLRFTYSEAGSRLEHASVAYAGQSTGAVYVYDTPATITNAKVYRSSTYGVHLANLDNFVFQGNELYLNTQRGLHIASGTNYDIVGNKVHNNSYGIYDASGAGHVIRGNTIVDNTQRGMYMAGTNGKVYNNLFRQASNAEDQGTGNLWNVTKVSAAPGTNIIGGEFFGGNRWSNYTGLDRDYDGLGDTLLPHKTIGKGLDRHPLTLPSEVIPDPNPPVTTLVVEGTVGDNGWYRSAVTATLSATDDSSGVKATYYTLNGGTQQDYAEPFVFPDDGAQTLGYWSKDKAGNVEAAKSADLKIDSVPPVTTHQLAGTQHPSGWYVTAVTVTLAATDATSGVAVTQSSLDGAAFQDYTAPFTLATEGAHTLRYRSKDLAGGLEANKTASASIDTLPPVTTAVLNGTLGNNGWFRSNVQVTLSATDAGSGVAALKFRLDGGALTTSLNGTATVTIATDGAHTLEFFAEDRVGHVEAVQSVAVKVDRAPPVTTLANGPPSWQDGTGFYATSATSFTMNAVDAVSGVNRTMYQVSLGGAFASDDAGGAEPAPGVAGLLGLLAPDAVRPDRAAAAAPGGGPTPDAFVQYTGPFSLPGADGARTVAYYSTDLAGNQENTRTKVVKVDNTAPNVAVSRPAIGSLSAFQVYVETDSDWDYGLDVLERQLGTNPYDPASRLPLNFPAEVNAIHDQYRYAYVVAGTQVPLTAAATDPVVNGVASGMDRVAFYVDGVLLGEDNAAPYEFAWDTSSLTLGEHRIEVRAFDHLGNSRAASVPVYALAMPADATSLVEALLALLPVDLTLPAEGPAEGLAVERTPAPVAVRVEAAGFERLLQAAREHGLAVGATRQG